jgi:hypothetical protein
MAALLSLRCLRVLATVAGVSAMLAGCGPGSGGASANGSGQPPASTPAASSGGPGAPASGGPGTAIGTAHVTGHFCTDFPRLLARVPKIPPGDKGNLPALRRDATRLLATATGYFTALAGEAPPQVASALRTVASVYQRNEGAALAQGSAAALERLIKTTQYAGSGLAALGVVARYDSSHCLGTH